MNATLIFIPFILLLFVLVWMEVSSKKAERKQDKQQNPHLYLGKNAFLVDDVSEAVDSLELEDSEH